MVLHPPELEAATEQITQFVRQYDPEVVMVEEPLYSERMIVAGTPDLFFRSPKIRRGNRLCLMDAKTGVGLMIGLQTTAYLLGHVSRIYRRKRTDT